MTPFQPFNNSNTLRKFKYNILYTVTLQDDINNNSGLHIFHIKLPMMEGFVKNLMPRSVI